jgi:hypothetical protein
VPSSELIRGELISIEHLIEAQQASPYSKHDLSLAARDPPGAVWRRQVPQAHAYAVRPNYKAFARNRHASTVASSDHFHSPVVGRLSPYVRLSVNRASSNNGIIVARKRPF